MNKKHNLIKNKKNLDQKSKTKFDVVESLQTVGIIVGVLLATPRLLKNILMPIINPQEPQTHFALEFEIMIGVGIFFLIAGIFRLIRWIIKRVKNKP